MSAASGRNNAAFDMPPPLAEQGFSRLRKETAAVRDGGRCRDLPRGGLQ
ncbi:hypothetical protein A33M_0138 [Rhodovulum sp. PH10]|nr:hypothetical protein A33M_0138 [Rhodovulum sp. PH10]